MPSKTLRYLLIILFYLVSNAMAEVSKCSPTCTMNDSCILVFSPSTKDTIYEGDPIPITFAVGIDLVEINFSADNGKSFSSLYSHAVTVTPCTTHIGYLRAPYLDSATTDEPLVRPCLIEVSAYGIGYPSGQSNYFYLKRKVSSIKNPYVTFKTNKAGAETMFDVHGRRLAPNCSRPGSYPYIICADKPRIAFGARANRK